MADVWDEKARWSMNDDADNTHVDDDLGGYDGTLDINSSVISESGVINKRFNLGGGHYFTTNFNSHTILNDSDFSLAFWILGYGVNGGIISATGTSGSGVDRFYFRTEALSGNNVKIRLGLGDKSIQSSGYIYDRSATRCMIIMFDATTEEVYYYVNDSLIETVSVAGIGGQFYDGTTHIGKQGTNLLNGKLDEFRIWSRLLTAEERTAFYNSGSGTEGAVTQSDTNPHNQSLIIM